MWLNDWGARLAIWRDTSGAKGTRASIPPAWLVLKMMEFLISAGLVVLMIGAFAHGLVQAVKADSARNNYGDVE
jgi:hypothetical protein